MDMLLIIGVLLLVGTHTILTFIAILKDRQLTKVLEVNTSIIRTFIAVTEEFMKKHEEKEKEIL